MTAATEKPRPALEGLDWLDEPVTTQAEAIEAAKPILKGLSHRLGFDSAPTANQLTELARFVVTERLDPYRGEVTWFMSKPLITYLGRLRRTLNHPQHRGTWSRPATPQERADARVGEDVHYWVAEVYRGDWAVPARGHGFVYIAKERNVTAKERPQLIAKKRSIEHAWRDAFGIDTAEADLSQDLDAVEGTLMAPPAGRGHEGAPQARTTEAPVQPHTVDATVGQIQAISTLASALGKDSARVAHELMELFGSALVKLTPEQAQAYLARLSAEAEARAETVAPEAPRTPIEDQVAAVLDGAAVLDPEGSEDGEMDITDAIPEDTLRLLAEVANEIGAMKAPAWRPEQLTGAMESCRKALAAPRTSRSGEALPALDEEQATALFQALIRACKGITVQADAVIQFVDPSMIMYVTNKMGTRRGDFASIASEWISAEESYFE